MNAPKDQRTNNLEDIAVLQNLELDRAFGDRILFPDKNKEAEELIRKYGLPNKIAKDHPVKN